MKRNSEQCRRAGIGRIRAFIALNFDDRSTARLASARERLLDNAAEGRAVPDRDLHMTLAFLGDTDVSRTEELRLIIKRAARPLPVLRVSGFGHFGDLYFASIDGTDELTDTWMALDRGLSEHGFRTEDRDFIPHVTLARKVRLISTPEPARFELRPVSVSLMRSELKRDGAVYTVLSSVRLTGR